MASCALRPVGKRLRLWAWLPSCPRRREVISSGAGAWGEEGTDPARGGTEQVVALVSLPERRPL